HLWALRTGNLRRCNEGNPHQLERLLERPQVYLLGPGRALLAMDLPVGLGNRLDAEQTVFAALLHDLRPPAAQAVPVDAAVDDTVRNVQAERPKFARHALRDHAQPCLGGRKLRKACLAAQTTRRPREDHRAPAERRQSPCRLAPHQETRKATDPPELLKELRRDLP